MASRTWSIEHGGSRSSSLVTAEVAFRIVLRYGGKVPTVQQLRDDWGMCRATAYRWVRSMKVAKGIV